MAKTARICVKIDPVLKEEVGKILHDIGLTHSEFIRMMYRQVVIHQGIPFELTTKKERKEPLDASKLTREELIAEIEKGYKDIEEGRVIDAEEVFDRLKKEYNL